jgi:NADH:ubiquinone oxidoreductase subunit 3 (subunit A)
MRETGTGQQVAQLDDRYMMMMMMMMTFNLKVLFINPGTIRTTLTNIIVVFPSLYLRTAENTKKM